MKKNAYQTLVNQSGIVFEKNINTDVGEYRLIIRRRYSDDAYFLVKFKNQKVTEIKNLSNFKANRFFRNVFKLGEIVTKVTIKAFRYGDGTRPCIVYEVYENNTRKSYDFVPLL